MVIWKKCELAGSVLRMRKKKDEPKLVLDLPDAFEIVAADLSLRRPGFARVSVQKRDTGYQITGVSFTSLDNKMKPRKHHGELLLEISRCMADFYPKQPLQSTVFFVRERGLDMVSTSAKTIEALSKVIGINDVFLWSHYKVESYEIPPYTVKRLVTGNYKAEKEEVAAALESYVGPQDYTCDDESDAVAVAVSFLIQCGALPEYKELMENPIYRH